MNSIGVLSRFGPRDMPPSRLVRRRRVIGLVAILVLAALASHFWWQSQRLSPDRKARTAAARGRNYLNIGRPDLALQAVNEIRDESPGAGEAMTVAGIALIRMQQYRVARLALERALKLSPNQVETVVTLAELNLDLGNTQRGSELLAMATHIRPHEFGIWRLLGRALNDLNHPADAANAYQKALELRHDDHEVLIELINILITSGQSDLALPWITKALERLPENPSVLGLAAREAFDTHRLDEAMAFADRALQQDPRNLDALIARARCRVTRSLWKEALPDIELAAVTEPNDLGTLQLLWIVETRLGLAERATLTMEKRKRSMERAKLMDELTEAIRENPDDPKLAFRMGELATQASAFLYASRCFEASLALDPDYEPARGALKDLRAAHPELQRNPSQPRSRLEFKGSPNGPNGRTR